MDRFEKEFIALMDKHGNAAFNGETESPFAHLLTEHNVTFVGFDGPSTERRYTFRSAQGEERSIVHEAF